MPADAPLSEKPDTENPDAALSEKPDTAKPYTANPDTVNPDAAQECPRNKAATGRNQPPVRIDRRSRMVDRLLMPRVGQPTTRNSVNFILTHLLQTHGEKRKSELSTRNMPRDAADLLEFSKEGDIQ